MTTLGAEVRAAASPWKPSPRSTTACTSTWAPGHVT